MYLFKRIDETLIQWISDSDTPKSSSPSRPQNPRPTSLDAIGGAS